MKKITKELREQLLEKLAFKKSIVKYTGYPDMHRADDGFVLTSLIEKMTVKDAMSLQPAALSELLLKEGVMFDQFGMALKGSKYLYENDEEKGILKRTIVANTYNWMDSHSDVHLEGCFTRSLQGRGKSAPHLHDHKFEMGARVGKPIKIEERSMSWRELGASKTGKTIALVLESEIRRSMNEGIYNDYLGNEINQHSVAMAYVDIALACDDEEDMPKEFALWQKVLPLLGNRKEAEEQGYFFAVSQAKLFEISCVLLGSNELTPTLGPKPAVTTPEPEEEEKTRPQDTRLLAEIEELHKTMLYKSMSR